MFCVKCRRLRFNPGVRRSHGEGNWLPNPVFLVTQIVKTLPAMMLILFYSWKFILLPSLVCSSCFSCQNSSDCRHYIYIPSKKKGEIAKSRIHLAWLVFIKKVKLSSVQFSSVQSLSRVRLCDPMNHSTPDLPVHHQFLESIQTLVHWVSDAIQPSHPLSQGLSFISHWPVLSHDHS